MQKGVYKMNIKDKVFKALKENMNTTRKILIDDLYRYGLLYHSDYQILIAMKNDDENIGYEKCKKELAVALQKKVDELCDTMYEEAKCQDIQ